MDIGPGGGWGGVVKAQVVGELGVSWEAAVCISQFVWFQRALVLCLEEGVDAVYVDGVFRSRLFCGC